MRAAALPLMVVAGVAGCGRATSPTPLSPSATRTRVPAALAPGTRVRYSMRGDEVGARTGRVARASADTLWLTSGSAVPITRLRRLDVSQGGPSDAIRIVRALAVGTAAGAGLGALVTPDSTNIHLPHTRGEAATLGALYGFIIGGVVGLVLPGERWDPVALPPTSN